MWISRRFFLRSGSMTAIAAGVALGTNGFVFGQKRQLTSVPGVDGIPYQVGQDALFYYTRAAFDPCVGSVFQARGANGRTVDLTLLSVSQYQTKASTRISSKTPRETDSFSLMFKASGKLRSYSQIPALSHPVLGKLEMFLTECVVDNEVYYEAVINHLI